jgi:predicted ATPase
LITHFAVRNFKSIEFASLRFKKLNFVVGRNGTGKTNLIDAMSFISETASKPLQMIFNSRGGTESVFRKVNPAFEGRSFDASALDRPRIQMAVSFSFPHLPSATSIAHGHYAFELESGFISKPSAERLVRVRREQIVTYDASGGKHWFDRIDQRIRASDAFFNRMPEGFLGSDSLSMPFLAGFPDFATVAYALRSIQSYSIDPGTLREFQDPDAAERLLPDGRNAVSILEQLRKGDKPSLERLLELLGAITPGTLNVTSMSAGRKRFLRFSQQWGRDKRFRFDAFNMSDGTLRAFGLLLASFQTNAPDYMIVEQPEDSLHPAATAVIIEALRARPKSLQTVITTHSPEVLDNLAPEEDAVFVVELADGSTRVSEIAPHLIEGVTQHLCSGGDLLRLRLVDQTLFPFAGHFNESLFEDL